MELDLLQISSGFLAGLIVGLLAMLIFNKLKSGSVSAGGVKQEFDDYKNEVEAHFETTSKKFQNMTEQYQDLYKHLATGATTLCRPDSVAAALADESDPSNKPAQIEANVENKPDDKLEPKSEKQPEQVKQPEPAKKMDKEPVKESADASIAAKKENQPKPEKPVVKSEVEVKPSTA